MKIGLFTDGLAHLPFHDALDLAASLGLQAVEIGTGNFSPARHCDLEAMLSSAGERRRFLDALESRDLTLSALNCSGNPLHPDEAKAASARDVVKRTMALAGELGLDRIVAMSGCPGTPDGSGYSHWVTVRWPPEMIDLLRWQWGERVLPYWREMAAWARQHGVTRICLELHPGMAVFNPATLDRLRAGVGEIVGANLDPSHFFWQGIDPIAAARALGRAVYHTHAKDTRIDRRATSVNGVLNAQWPGPEGDVAWTFATMGYGHGELFWKQFYYTLRQIGYDDILSIEYEDEGVGAEESIRKSAAFLRQVAFTGDEA
ncbi:MAG TPA: sugar phosphate isomerase/epimerase [Chloroflexota bacterium]|nr:sugar phosphate isomerase/epimerase [Chloroflexota bacterium]